ncbi:MAG: PilZ domain-containing protein [Proteobacteria bacterium]|nr:MAG: PilZ domain-containing protein [Pseudomonadota bacterium]
MIPKQMGIRRIVPPLGGMGYAWNGTRPTTDRPTTEVGDGMNRDERNYDEKRDFYRMAVDCPISFRVTGSQQDGHGICRNLSASGVLMELQESLEIGTGLNIRIEPQSSITGALAALAQVSRCDPAPDGSGFTVAATILEITS